MKLAYLDRRLTPAHWDGAAVSYRALVRALARRDPAVTYLRPHVPQADLASGGGLRDGVVAWRGERAPLVPALRSLAS